MAKKKDKAEALAEDVSKGKGLGATLIERMKKDRSLNQMIVTPETLKASWLNTNVMSLNLVFGGKVRGGIKKGAITTIAADSQLGKSLIGYNILQAAYRAGMQCVVIDAEHSINFDLLKQLGIDPENILVYQTSMIPEIKQIYAKINKGLTRDEMRNIFVLVDSWGPIVEVQVLEHAEEASSAVNMSAPKFKNELANVINAYNNTSFIINHVSSSLNKYDPWNVPGGKRLFFNSDSIGLASSAAKYKDTQDNILGKVVTIGVKKGRGAKEFLKTQYLIRHDGGLDPFFGLLDEAQEAGCVFKSKPGYYARTDYDVDKSTGEVIKHWKESELYCAAFWIPLYRDEKFVNYVEDKFSFINTTLISSSVNIMDMIDGTAPITDESVPVLSDEEVESLDTSTDFFEKHAASEEEVAEYEEEQKKSKKSKKAKAAEAEEPEEI